MPVSISAKKKLRQDNKRKKQNNIVKKAIKDAIKAFRRKPSVNLLSKVFSLLDKAKKKKIFHANKVMRQKIKFSKFLVKRPSNILKTEKTPATKSQKSSRLKKTSPSHQSSL